MLSLQECKNGYTEELGDELGEFRCDVVFNFRKGAFHPTFPEILGAKEKVFEGKAWHTMNWPSDGTEYLTGKRVAIVGCAAAGIQVSATIAPLVKSMVICGFDIIWLLWLLVGSEADVEVGVSIAARSFSRHQITGPRTTSCPVPTRFGAKSKRKPGKRILGSGKCGVPNAAWTRTTPPGR